MDIQAHEARVNVTYAGVNADLPDPVPFDSTDQDVRAMVSEAIRSGTLPGIQAVQNVDLTDFVVEKFGSSDVRPWNLLSLRPKVPFGRSV